MSPDMIPRSVVLPAPERPVIATIDEGSTVKLTSSRIVRLPNEALTPSTERSTGPGSDS